MMEDVVYVVIDLSADGEKIISATTEEEVARMHVASAEDGHHRFIEIFENGVKLAEFGYR